MAGDVLSRSDRRRLAQRVHQAERTTGLQIALYVGPAEDDPAAHAERLLHESGAASRPAVLLLVALDVRRIEIRTSATAHPRVPDEAAARAVAAMTPLLAAGDLVGGVGAGLEAIVAAAGPGKADGTELPDVLTP